MSSDRPTLARRQLGLELRKLREAAGLNASEAAEYLGLHRNTINNIEKGKQGTKPYLVEALCTKAYGAPPDIMSYLTGLAVNGKKRGLWERNEPGMRPGLQWFASAEAEYNLIMTWEPLNIPGLLQVPSYYDRQRASGPPLPEVEDKALKDFRFKRQHIVFNRNPPPETRFIIGEGALNVLDHLPPAVKDAQIAHLVDKAGLAHVDIKVLGGMHPAMTGAFTILSPGSEGKDDLAFVYLEAIDACRYVEDIDVVSRFVKTFTDIQAIATPIKEYLK